MSEITTLLGDVGGVILTNGWDRDNRRQAAEHFNLDGEEMQERHERVLVDFETGRLSLAEYLGRTVFYQARSFFVGVRKPDEAIYRLAIRVTQRRPGACLFIDDRELNLEGARLLDMRTIHYQSPAQLREELRRHGVTL
jgi:beta-phosphoglucomutase-like phosphatase (HAD superfamily)